MSTIEKIVGTMLMLVALFLVLDKYTGAKAIIEALAGFGSTIFRTLQGRSLQG